MRLHPVKCTSAAVFGHQPLCIIDLGTRDEYMQQCARRQRQASTLLHVEPAATPKEDSATFVGTLVVTRRREWRHFKAPSAWQGRGRADLPSGSASHSAVARRESAPR